MNRSLSTRRRARQAARGARRRGMYRVMELPFALLLLVALLVLAWATPSLVAGLFVLAVVAEAASMALALLARRSRDGQ